MEGFEEKIYLYCINVPSSLKLDTGADSRITKLEEDYNKEFDDGSGDTFLDFMKEMDATFVLKFDLLNAFALLPPPDSAVDRLFRNTVNHGKSENPVKPKAQDEFERYQATFLFALVAYKDKALPKYMRIGEFEGSISWEDYQQNVLHTKGAMPAKCDWGKVRIWEHFERETVIDDHELYIQDSSNIPAGHPIFTVAGASVRPPFGNELTAAIKRPSMIGGTVDKSHLSKQYKLGRVSGSPFMEVTIAGKAENTKGIAKTREIYTLPQLP